MLDTADLAFEKNEIVNVFPNPSKGKVNVILKEGVAVDVVTLYDIAGKVLYNSNNINELETVLNKLDSGVYIIKVVSANGSQTKKLVVTR